MKLKFSLVAILSISYLYAEPTNSELLDRIKLLENKLETQQSTTNSSSILPQITTKNSGNQYGKLVIGGDYRFSVDNLNYNLVNGKKAKNDDLLTNRLWLNFSYKPNWHIDFNAKLAFNKVFGQPAIYAPNGVAPFDGFDWVASTTNTDDRFRVKNAYINYRDDHLFGAKIDWDFGVGRRSTSYNQLISLRDDTKANSPIGHLVSAEFDGGHLGFKLDKLTGVSGMKVKFAAGRGLSYVNPSLSATPNVNWGDNINMFDMNFVTYADQRLHTEFQIIHIDNLVDITNAGYDRTGTFNPQNFNPMLDNVGDMDLGAFMVTYKMPEFQNANFFASYAVSQTNPNSGKNMLGSTDDETGYSYWVGSQWDCIFTDNAKLGVEYNHGSQYWRSFTYAEDTAAGSKIATRGDAYEIYLTKHITKGLSFQARYTYMDYDYTGSTGFFGSQTGSAMKISDVKKYMAGTDLANSIVKSAQDVRFYLRYSF